MWKNGKEYVSGQYKISVLCTIPDTIDSSLDKKNTIF
jgi:hypothetical protein